MKHREFFGSLKCMLLIILCFPFLDSPQELLEIPKPTHLVKGVPVATLKLVHEIKSDFGEDLFFAYPWTLQVSKTGMIYVYDMKLIKIFMFNQERQYIGQFLSPGQGPAEVFPGFPMNKSFHAGVDGKFYVCDSLGDRLIQFSGTGKFLKQTRMNRRRVTEMPFPPIIDREGNFYAYSSTGIVDKLDSGMKVIHTYLDLKLNGEFLGYRPIKGRMPHSNQDIWLYPDFTNTLYGFTGGYLLIYLERSSTAYVFKGEQLIRKFTILIDEVIPEFEQRAKKAYKVQKEKGDKVIAHADMFSFYFVDQDEPGFYLTQAGGKPGSNKLYRFDLEGNMTRIIDNIKADIRVKRNGLFYGFLANSRNPGIFKLEEVSK